MYLLGLRNVVRRRFAGPVVRGADGRVVAPAATDTTIQASVQPAGEDALATLPEAERTREARVLFTTADLRSLDQGAALLADHVMIDGVAFEVRGVATWAAPHFLQHRQIVAVRVQEAP